MSCPTEPSVTNSKDAVLTNNSNSIDAYYECLTGFSMSGNQTITCNTSVGTWPTAPVCTVIESNVYVYTSSVTGESWWPILLAFCLVGFLLLFLALVIWCFCWAPRADNGCCSCCRGRHHTMPMNQGIYRDSIFWQHGTPVKPNQEGPVRSGNSQLTPISASQDHQGQGQGRNFQTVPPIAGTNPKLVPVEIDKDSASVRSPREAPVYRTQRPAKDPSKEVKMWMPHSHNVRDINTSTK